MNLVIKHFSELTTDELFEIYKLRTAVFVVEQNCPYQEVDDADNQFLQNEMTAVECLAVVNGQTLFYKHSVLPFIFLVILDSLPLELPSK